MSDCTAIYLEMQSSGSFAYAPRWTAMSVIQCNKVLQPNYPDIKYGTAKDYSRLHLKEISLLVWIPELSQLSRPRLIFEIF